MACYDQQDVFGNDTPMSAANKFSTLQDMPVGPPSEEQHNVNFDSHFLQHRCTLPSCYQVREFWSIDVC